MYVDCKKSAIDLATSFNQHTDIKTAAYTGEDTSKADKKSVLMNWSADEITLVVATSAFGLGVNKPDVRNVIHLGVPDSLESWMQKAGRGGRDGNNCVGVFSCLTLLWVNCSHSINRYLINHCSFSATVLYDTNFQILDFYLRGRDESSQERMKAKFADVWRYVCVTAIFLIHV